MNNFIEIPLGRAKNLKGLKFGYLTPLYRIKNTKNDKALWACQCKCGNIISVIGTDLSSGHTTSCGCKNKEQITALGHSHALDLTNKRFGKLTVIKKADKKLPYSDSIAWICKCDCGNEIITTTSALNSGNTNSCGCNHKSEGEELIKNILIKEKVNFEIEK